MALLSLRQLLDHAAENGYGLPAFNVNNLEQVKAIMEAADETNSPVIMQGSAGARKYAGEAFLRHLISAAVEAYPHIPVVMHQDHGASPAVCINAIKSGFSSVMMDGSLKEDAKTPSSFEYNVDVTRRVVEMSHAVGVSVEGELGCLGSLESGMGEKEDGHGAEGVLTHDQLLTDPNEAAEFVKLTQVDALAIAIGTSHGVRKVNIDTDLRMASSGAARRYLAQNPKDFDPRKFLAASTKAMKDICKARYEAFGCARSEEHTSELQSHLNLVCRLLLEKKKMFYQRQIVNSPPAFYELRKLNL